MLYNVRQSYTPSLEPCEFNEHSLAIDTETVGAGAAIEVVEIALSDYDGKIIFNSLIRPLYNRPPRSTREQRFDPAEFASAPDWPEAWAEVSPLIEGKLLIAYNAAFDRRALAAMCARNRTRSNERGWRCAMQLVKQSMATRRNVTLSEACARHGLEGGNHRAGEDVRATYRLLKCLMATYTEKGQKRKSVASEAS